MNCCRSEVVGTGAVALLAHGWGTNGMFGAEARAQYGDTLQTICACRCRRALPAPYRLLPCPEPAKPAHLVSGLHSIPAVHSTLVIPSIPSIPFISFLLAFMSEMCNLPSTDLSVSSLDDTATRP